WTNNQFVYTSGTQSKHYYALLGPQLTTLSGSASTTQGSATITGSGTTFTSTVAVGNGLLVGNAYFIVKSVDSNTQITATIAARSTASGQTVSVSACPKEGSAYDVTANDASTLTLNLNGDTLSGVGANTQVTILPYPSLSSVFPASDAGTSFVASSSAFIRKTEIYIPNYSGSGINLSTAKSYFFLNGAWRLAGNAVTEDHGDDILLPGAYFQIRNNDGTTTTLTFTGNVPTRKKLSLPVATQTGTKHDNLLSLSRPVDTSLNQLGLVESGAFTPSTSTFLRADELYVFDNTQVGFNKSASATYFYYNGAWRKANQDVTVDAGSDVIPAGSGFVVRKATTNNGATQFWQNAPSYD